MKKRHGWNRALSLFLVATLCLSLIPATALAEETDGKEEVLENADVSDVADSVSDAGVSAVSDTVSNTAAEVTVGSTTNTYTRLAQAFEYANNQTEAVVIKLLASAEVDETLSVSLESGITLDLNGYTVTGAEEISVITVSGSGKLTLTDTSEAGEGKLTGARHGVTVEAAEGTFIMEGGNISGNAANSNKIFGIGVYAPNSTVTMSGGKITGNTNSTGTNGGGVYAETLIMSGGEISGNTIATNSTAGRGGNVFAKNLTMTGGNISKSTGGYGVFINGGTFDLSGGTISENYIGGVYTAANSILNISGGEISGNGTSTLTTMGGIFMLKGTLTMTGGKITGNTATSTSASGGIYAGTGGTELTISGGEISNNTSKNGGGLYIKGSSATIPTVVTLSDNAVISGNNASTNGGGIYQGSYGFIYLNGGEIKNNTTTGSGGGIYSSAALYMTGGSIIGNTASVNGGGVYTSGTNVFQMTGGSVTGNTATLGGGVYGYSSAISLGGTPVIKDNTLSDGETSGNLYLISGRSISIVSELTEGAHVGILTEAEPEELTPVTVAVGKDYCGSAWQYLYPEEGEYFLWANEDTGIMDLRTYGVRIDSSAIYKKVGDDSGKLTVSSSPVLGTELRYQWYRAESEDAAEGTPVNGAASADYTISTASAEDAWYYCVVTTASEGENAAETCVTNRIHVTVSSDYLAKVTADDTTTGYYTVEEAFAAAAAAGYESAVITIYGDFAIGESLAMSSGNITLDLNGHTIKADVAMNDSILKITGGSMTLTDTSSGKNGMITGGLGFNTFGGGVYVKDGNFTLAGGKISGNKVTGTSSVTGLGGGVYVNGGSFTMTGGEISGNVATISKTYAGRGGGVYLTGCTFTMSGGVISGNEQRHSLSNPTNYTYGGGGIFINTGVTFTMTGGEISNNKAGTTGGGIMVYRSTTAAKASTLTITGGTITGNVAGVKGGGIYFGYKLNTLNLSGNPVISENSQISGVTDNLCLDRTNATYTAYITLADNLSAGAKIGISDYSSPTAEAAIQISVAESDTAYYKTALNYIASDNEKYKMTANETEGYLELQYVGITDAETPVIASAQLQDAEYLSGDAAEPLSVTATLKNAGSTLSYQWYSKTGENEEETAIEGATSSSYTPSTEVIGTSWYYCIVTNTDSAATENQTATVTSETAKIRILDEFGENDVTAEGYTGIYDGNSHGASVTLADKAEGAQITFSETENGTYTETAPLYAAVGTYTVYYRVSKDGYDTVSGSAEVTITQAEQSVSYEETEVSKLATEESFTNPLTETCVFGATTYTSSDENVAKVDEKTGEVTILSAGTTVITANVSGSENYTEATASYTLNITNDSFGENDIAVEGYSGIYDGNSHSVTVTLTGKAEGAQVRFRATEDESYVIVAPWYTSVGTYTETEPSYTDVGSYTVYYQVSKAGYDTVGGSVKVVITQAEQSVSYEETEVTKLTSDASFINPLTETCVFGAVTYTSSDETVAEVDEKTGEVTILSEGTTVITATASGSENYTEAAASYTLTVELAGAVIRSAGDALGYYVDGVLQTDYTGIALGYYIVNGLVDSDYTGIADSSYIEKGMVKETYTGFAEGTDGWYYIVNGTISEDTCSVIKDKNVYGESPVDGTFGWWYVIDGKVQTDYTNIANYKNENGWWYIRNGKVDFSYTGFSTNKNGDWYVERGQVKFNRSTVLKDTDGALGEAGAWYYVVRSKVRTDYTGVANYKNNNGWWYVKNGKVDFGFTGIASNNNGTWYVERGQVKFNRSTVLKDTNGALGEAGAWYYVVRSRVRTDYTGVANYKNNNGWWYVKNGKVDFSFTGIASNNNGTWYVKGGKVNFGYTGTITYKGVRYQILRGKVVKR